MASLDERARQEKQRMEEAQQNRKLQVMINRHKARTDWRVNLRANSKEQLFGDGKNVELALEHAPELKGLVRFNELSKRVVFTRNPPWSKRKRTGDYWIDIDSLGLLTWLQGMDVPVTSAPLMADVVHLYARENHYFHPIRDWFGLLQWDEQPRIEDVLIKVLGVEKNIPFTRMVLRKFMISAVARVMEPGCKADHMLVLISDQGIRKSTFAQVLATPWAKEGISSFGSKDSMVEIRGAWIVETPELAGMKKSDIEQIKSFLSRTVDSYRPPYGRHAIDQKRGCVFIGTTNQNLFLHDATGNRRFWPVKCANRVDLRLLQLHQEQLWAEAVDAYNKGEQWWLTEEEEVLASAVQEQHRFITDLEGQVGEYLERRIQDHSSRIPLMVLVRDIFCSIYGSRDASDLIKYRSIEMKIGEVCSKRGWIHLGPKTEARIAAYEAPPTSKGT